MKIKSIIHVIMAYILINLTDEFSITVANEVCSGYVSSCLLYMVLGIISLLLVVHLYTKYIMKIKMQDIFLGKPLPERKWCIVAVIMPVAICLFYIFFTKGTFVKGQFSKEDLIYAFVLSVFSLGIRAAVTEEIIFRGMILKVFQEGFGKKYAVIISGLLFAVQHFAVIDTSDYAKVVLAIISIGIIGIALALVTYQTGSIWSSVVIHAMYNILSGESQILHIDVEQNFPAIWMYTVNSKNPLLIGINGSVGFTAAVPAMVGFTSIIFMVIYYDKKKKTV